MRYIDADLLNQRMYHEVFEIDSDMQKWDSGCWIRYKVFENCLEQIPTADVRENVKGEWKREVLGSTGGYGTTVMYQCSTCERMSISEYNYCPNCGADMRSSGERKEDNDKKNL